MRVRHKGLKNITVHTAHGVVELDEQGVVKSDDQAKLAKLVAGGLFEEVTLDGKLVKARVPASPAPVEDDDDEEDSDEVPNLADSDGRAAAIAEADDEEEPTPVKKVKKGKKK